MSDMSMGQGWWQARDDKWYPPRWEYRWAKGWLNPKRSHEPIEELVKELGLRGWEAVSYSISDNAISGSAHVVVLMKRPVFK